MAPFRYRCRGFLATLEDDHVHIAFGKVRRCSKTLRARSDDHNRKLIHHISSNRSSSIRKLFRIYRRMSIRARLDP